MRGSTHESCYSIRITTAILRAAYRATRLFTTQQVFRCMPKIYGTQCIDGAESTWIQIQIKTATTSITPQLSLGALKVQKHNLLAAALLIRGRTCRGTTGYARSGSASRTTSDENMTYQLYPVCYLALSHSSCPPSAEPTPHQTLHISSAIQSCAETPSSIIVREYRTGILSEGVNAPLRRVRRH